VKDSGSRIALAVRLLVRTQTGPVKTGSTGVKLMPVKAFFWTSAQKEVIDQPSHGSTVCISTALGGVDLFDGIQTHHGVHREYCDIIHPRQLSAATTDPQGVEIACQFGSRLLRLPQFNVRKRAVLPDFPESLDKGFIRGGALCQDFDLRLYPLVGGCFQFSRIIQPGMQGLLIAVATAG